MLPYKKYQRMNISTADPLRIVILLYEGAIKFLNQALRTIDSDALSAGQKINRAVDIIYYLRNSLDHERGGEISGNLQRLYDYLRGILTDANIHRDSEKIKEAITLLQTLLEGWRGIITTGQTSDGEASPTPETLTPPPADADGLSMVG